MFGSDAFFKSFNMAKTNLKQARENRRDPKLAKRSDGLRPSAATLIVTPNAILSQWTAELALHALLPFPDSAGRQPEPHRIEQRRGAFAVRVEAQRPGRGKRRRPRRSGRV